MFDKGGSADGAEGSDPLRTAGAGGAGSVAGVAGAVAVVSAVEAVLGPQLRAWWMAERPGWVDPGWYAIDVRPEVRRLMRLDPGPLLINALMSLRHTYTPRGPRPLPGQAGTGSAGGPRSAVRGAAPRGTPQAGFPVPGAACPYPHPGMAAPGEPEAGSVPGFPCACQMVVAAAWAAVSEWCQVQAQAAVVAVAGAAEVELPEVDRWPRMADPAREELAVALRLSPGSAASRIASARDLAAHPGLAAAVEAGLCSGWAVKQVLADCAALDPHQQTAVVTELLDKLADRHRCGRRPWIPSEVLAAARRIRLRRFPDSAAKAKARARSRRRVVLVEQGDGSTDLIATLPTLDAHRIHRRLTALAAGLDDPTRTRDQKRADLLTDLLLHTPTPGVPTRSSGVGSGRGAHGGGSVDGPDAGDHIGADGGRGPDPGDGPAPGSPDAPGRGGAGVEVCVVVSLETLLRLADEPAHLVGHGPLDADTARDLAADGRWRAWITDAVGTLTATGTRSYTPTTALARHVRAREPYCRMPGCRRPSYLCDLDHTVPYPAGATAPENLGPLCRRHHHQKTRRRWQLDNTDDGYTWTTPTGATLHTHHEPPLEPALEPPPDPPCSDPPPQGAPG